MRRLFAILALPLLWPPTASAAVMTIIQSNRMFSQTDLSIKAGDHVQFLNRDDVAHDILLDEGDERDLGIQRPHDPPLDVIFDKAGKFKLRCRIHPDMKLAIEVH